MGNKSKGSKGAANSAPKASVSKKSKASTLTTLLNIESILQDDSRWAAGEKIRETLDATEKAVLKLRQIQSGWPSALPQRNEHTFTSFTAWLMQHGIDMDKLPLRIARVPGDDSYDNATLFATREIAEGNVFVIVPSTAMMSTTTAATSSVGGLLAAVPALRATPSIALTLHVLAEALNPDSVFQPYIQVLPSRFSIPFSLPFSTDQLLSLRPSQAFERAVKTLRSQLVHYVNIYKLLNRPQTACAGLSVDSFSYVNFEWAVSVVMTRQNQLPGPGPGRPPVLALVPVWDMCNHAVGPPSPAGRPEGGRAPAAVECAAMRTFAEGEAVTIFYGERSNVELLLFSGFVQPGNEHDSLAVPIAFDSPDKRENVAKVVELRRKLRGVVSGVDGDGNMTVSGRVLGVGGGTIDSSLLSIAKVKAIDFASNPSHSNLKDDGGTEAEICEGTSRILEESIRGCISAYPDMSTLNSAKECGATSPIGSSLVRLLHQEEKRILQGAITKLHKDVARL